MFTIQKITDIDTFTFNWLQTRRMAYRHLSLVSRTISRVGDGFFYAVIGALLALFDGVSGATFLMVGLLAYLIELPVYWVLKNSIRRPRPSSKQGVNAVIVPSDTFSFPSGHAAAAFLFATLVTQYYPHLAPLGYSVAFLIGVSRVVLGVHYPTDIAAGAALGVACAELGLMIWLIL